MPAISVIVPLYNVQAYIEACLMSLKRQTFSDFEVLCIDDASTDNTLAIARKTAEDDDRFIFFTQQHKGQSAARNVGLTHATGTYVVFLDADDYYDDETLSILFERAERDSLDDLFFSARTIYESIKMRSVYRDDYDNRKAIDGVMTGRELLVQFGTTDSFCVSAALQFIRRNFLLEADIRFYEGIVQEDNLFTCLVLAHAERCSYINERLYVRRIRPESTMTQKRGIRHVYGYFKCAYELETWLYTQANECQPAFVRCLLHHIAFCYDQAAFYAASLDVTSLEECAGGLSTPEELSFRLHVIEHAQEMDGVRREYLDSTTYKIGRVFTAVPCFIKERLRRFV